MKDRNDKLVHDIYDSMLEHNDHQLAEQLIRNFLYNKRPMLKVALDYMNIPNDDGLTEGDLDAFETKTNQNIADMKQGNAYNCELVKARMDQMEKSNDMQTVRQIKAHVLDFANSCLNGRKHTKQDFDNLIKENEDYEVLVKKYGLVNDVYTEDFHYIMKVYRKCMEERSFLRDDG